MSSAFEPYTLAGVSLRNHFVRSATVGPYSTDGVMSSAGICHYKKLAQNKVGLIITEMAYVSPDGQASRTQFSISRDKDLAQHESLVQAVHEEGGRVFLQINHAGAASLCDLPVSPSGVESPYTKKPCRAMTEEEMEKTTQDFAQAALRGKRAGYDGIQIHCAHGYLLSQFISPLFNQRTDAYGGTAENRFRFPAKVIAAVKAAVGADYPVCVKINSNAEIDDEHYEEALMWMGQECARLGICAIEVSGHDFTPQGRSGKHNYYLERAVRLRQSCSLPVILVGGIRTQADITQVLEAGLDLISMSRPYICQPDLIPMLEAGADSQCVSCSKCFLMLRKFEDEGRICIRHSQGGDR